MYEKHEPSALFHGLHHAHKRRVAEEQARRGLEEVGAPWLLVTLFHAEERGERWSQRDVARTMRTFSPEEKAQLTGFFHRMIENLGGMEPPPFVSREKESED